MIHFYHRTGRAFIVIACMLLCLDAKGADLAIHFSWGDRTAVERETLLELIVYRNGSAEAQSVDFRVIPGTAQDGRDIVAATGTVHFQPGEDYRTFNVQLLDDSEIEAPEQFTVVLENPSPNATIDPASIDMTLADDETGYSLGATEAPSEDAPFVEVKIRRHGDFTFESSVEVELAPAPATDWSIPARPGIDYVDERFAVTFAAGVPEQTIRVTLLNDTEEDGNRTFVARLRNPTGGIPISEAGELWLGILDNELAYSVRSDAHPDTHYSQLEVFEGEATRLFLVRKGDYNVRSTATVTISQLSWPRAAAEAGADFIARSFKLEFEPGQTIAPIPLEIIDDQIPEGAEVFNLSYPKSVTDSSTQEIIVHLRDNEFNPLPIRPVCLGDDQRNGESLQPTRYIVAVRDGFLLQVNSEPWHRQPSQLLRLNNDGSTDATFHPIDLGLSPNLTPTVIETTDRKYLVLYDRVLKRYLTNGETDPGFQSFTAENINNIAAAGDKPHINTGKTIIRLNLDGTADQTFASPMMSDNEGIMYVLAGPNGAVYIQGWLSPFEFPLIRNIARLTETGAYDPTFIAEDLVGTAFAHNGTLFIKNNEGAINRITPFGGIDPTFSRIETLWSDIHGMDLEGNFYFQRSWLGGCRIEKFTQDGVLDPLFFPGEIDSQGGSPYSAFSLDGTKLLLIPATYYYSDINGVSPVCYATPYARPYALALFDLIPPPRVISYPKVNLLEREDGKPDKIDAVCAGPNASTSMLASYRVRDGSAVNGRDFAMAPTGAIEFAPGVSRIGLPAPIINNTVADRFRNFFIDILNSEGAINSTTEIQILNDDPGIEILGIANNRLQLSLISGDFWNFGWAVSSDFQHWDTGYQTSTGYVVEIDLTGPGRFVTGAIRGLGSGASTRDTPVFSHR